MGQSCRRALSSGIANSRNYGLTVSTQSILFMFVVIKEILPL